MRRSCRRGGRDVPGTVPAPVPALGPAPPGPAPPRGRSPQGPQDGVAAPAPAARLLRWQQEGAGLPPAAPSPVSSFPCAARAAEGRLVCLVGRHHGCYVRDKGGKCAQGVQQEAFFFFFSSRGGCVSTLRAGGGEVWRHREQHPWARPRVGGCAPEAGWLRQRCCPALTLLHTHVAASFFSTEGSFSLMVLRRRACGFLHWICCDCEGEPPERCTQGRVAPGLQAMTLLQTLHCGTPFCLTPVLHTKTWTLPHTTLVCHRTACISFKKLL